MSKDPGQVKREVTQGEMQSSYLACMALSDEDIYSAMKSISGYLDITPADFKEIYLLAYKHAHLRVATALTASDIMTREVVTVVPETPVQEVAMLLAEHEVSGMPVMLDSTTVAGMITEKDFLRQMGAKKTATFMAMVSECLSGGGCEAAHLRTKCARDIMTTPPITVRHDTTVGEISRIFAQQKINRVAVVDNNDRLTGIVSRGDIIKASLLVSSL